MARMRDAGTARAEVGGRFQRPDPSFCSRSDSCLFSSGSQSHGGLGHLALAKLGQKNIIHCELAALGADDIFAEGRAHPTVVNSNLADITIEGLSAFLALKIDRHRIISVSFVYQRRA